MSNSLMLDAEAQLAADCNNSYKAQLIELLEKYRDDFISSKQGFLPPEESNLVEHLENAITAAISVISNYQAEPTERVEEPGGMIFTP